MIHSMLNLRPVREAFPYQNVGDEDDLSADLMALVIAYFIEAERHRRASMITALRDNGRTLLYVRDRYLLGDISAEDADIWRDAGSEYLQSIVRDRENHGR